MNIKMMNEIKSQGHPCSGCPYVFTLPTPPFPDVRGIRAADVPMFLLGVAQTASWVLFRGTVHGIFTSG